MPGGHPAPAPGHDEADDVAGWTAHGAGITHDWGEDGWAPFTASVMTDAQVVNGAPQTFALTVANGSGVVTGTQPAPAIDHRSVSA